VPGTAGSLAYASGFETPRLRFGFRGPSLTRRVSRSLAYASGFEVPRLRVGFRGPSLTRRVSRSLAYASGFDTPRLRVGFQGPLLTLRVSIIHAWEHLGPSRYAGIIPAAPSRRARRILWPPRKVLVTNRVRNWKFVKLLTKGTPRGAAWNPVLTIGISRQGAPRQESKVKA